MVKFAKLVCAGCLLILVSQGHNTARNMCLQDARQGDSPGGTTITAEERAACEALPDVDIDDKSA
jgi:hypothetical protein